MPHLIMNQLVAIVIWVMKATAQSFCLVRLVVLANTETILYRYYVSHAQMANFRRKKPLQNHAPLVVKTPCHPQIGSLKHKTTVYVQARYTSTILQMTSNVIQAVTKEHTLYNNTISEDSAHSVHFINFKMRRTHWNANHVPTEVLFSVQAAHHEEIVFQIKIFVCRTRTAF